MEWGPPAIFFKPLRCAEAVGKCQRGAGVSYFGTAFYFVYSAGVVVRCCATVALGWRCPVIGPKISRPVARLWLVLHGSYRICFLLFFTIFMSLWQKRYGCPENALPCDWPKNHPPSGSAVVGLTWAVSYFETIVYGWP